MHLDERKGGGKKKENDLINRPAKLTYLLQKEEKTRELILHRFYTKGTRCHSLHWEGS